MATSTTTVGAPPKSGELLSERIAPGILPKVLGRFDMIAIFVAIVLFAVQGSVVQPAGASAFVYWILGFVTSGAAILTVGLAGLAWLLGGHPAANDFSRSAFGLNSGNATFYGLVILALLGIEVPLNMGVEIRDRKAITSYLVWGSIVVMVGYLVLTFGAMVTVPVKNVNSTTAILSAVQTSLGAFLAGVVTLVMVAFFIFNTTVYNYSFARLLFVSGLDRRLPAFIGRVNRNKVPQNAVLVQAVITTIITAIAYFLFGGNTNISVGIYIALQAAVTVIWCLSMVFLFTDVLVIRSKYPEEFKREQLVPVGVFWAASIAGAIASAVGVLVTLTGGWLFTGHLQGSWNPAVIDNGPWILIVGSVGIASLAVAVVVYLLVLNTARRAVAAATGAGSRS